MVVALDEGLVDMSIWPSKCDETYAMTLACYLVVKQGQFALKFINGKIAIPFTWWRDSQSYKLLNKCECCHSLFTSKWYLFLKSLFEWRHLLRKLMVNNSQNDFNVDHGKADTYASQLPSSKQMWCKKFELNKSEAQSSLISHQFVQKFESCDLDLQKAVGHSRNEVDWFCNEVMKLHTVGRLEELKKLRKQLWSILSWRCY